MKTIKIFFAACMLAIAGFTVSAFTKPAAPVVEGWFELTDPQNPFDAESYTYVDDEQPCNGAAALCGIYGIKSGGVHPIQQSVDDASADSEEFSKPSDLVAYEE